jgi:predicted small secreted protein
MFSKMRVAASITLLLIIGSWVLAGCASSGPAGLGEGRGMLYFYATW